MTNTRSTRIEVADALRGLSMLGISIIHFILRFNNYPAAMVETSNTIKTLDSIVYYFSYLYIIPEALAIFAILFGFSFYIQNDNALKKGESFTKKFIWRLFILFLIGNINGMFFVGEILVQYAITALWLPLFIKLKTRTLVITIIAILLIPFGWISLLMSTTSLNDSYLKLMSLSYHHVGDTLKNGTFSEILYSNFRYAQINSLIGRVWNGDLFKLVAFFLIGIIIGRQQAFIFTLENIKRWKKTAIVSGILSLVLAIILGFTNHYRENSLIHKLIPIVSNYYATAMLFFVVSGFVLVYYLSPKGHAVLYKLIPAGRASLTIYFTQSIVGAFLFYNWGLNIGSQINDIYLFIFGIAIFVIQNYISALWLKSYKNAPVEYIWKKLSDIKFNSSLKS